MSPRPGRRIGRTRLTLPQVEARHRAIAKLEQRGRPRWAVRGPREDGLYEVIRDTRPAPELPGHHLQRAAAENA